MARGKERKRKAFMILFDDKIKRIKKHPPEVIGSSPNGQVRK